MTNTGILKRPLAAVILLGTLALGGCSGTNVGSSWQCPLARGGTCDSVAAADPAVPQAASVPAGMSDSGAVRKPVLREPLYRVRAAAGPSRRPSPAKPGAASIPSPGWRGSSGRTPAREPAPDWIRGPGQGTAAGTIPGRPVPGR